MKLLVIGDPARREQDMLIVERGKEIFDSVFYAPVNTISIETGRHSSVRCKSKELGIYDCTIPIPTNKYKELFTSIVGTLQERTQMPFSLDALMLLQRKSLTLSRLKMLEFSSLDFNYAISEVIENAKFPSEVIIGSSSAIADNQRELNNMMKWRKAGQSIMVKELTSDETVECLVMGQEVVGCFRRQGKKTQYINIGADLKTQLVNMTKFLNTEYAAITLSENKVTNISLTPDFLLFKKLTNKDILTPLLRSLRSKVVKEMTVIDSIVEFVRRLS